jgi:hypothetical protein
MSASDKWGNYKTPCPDCGGVVEYWSFDSDCRGNSGGSGIQCKQCSRSFTYDEWCRVAKKEMAKEVAARERAARKYKREAERKEKFRKKALAKLTPAERKALDL